MVAKVVFIVNLAELIVGCLEGSVLKVDLAGAVNTKGETSGFGSQVILGGSLCLSGPCEFQLSC